VALCRSCVNRCFPETSIHTRCTWRHIPEDVILHNHRRENLKTYKVVHSFLFIQLRVILVSVFFTAWILTQAAHLPSQARGQGVSHRGHGGSHKGHGHAELGKVSTENTSGLIVHLSKFSQSGEHVHAARVVCDTCTANWTFLDSKICFRLKQPRRN
jgi:hypothetical protein